MALRSVARASLDALIFESKKWIASFYSMTLFTNLICSCTYILSTTAALVRSLSFPSPLIALLAWRIWWTHRNTARLSHTVSDHRVMTAAIIVIESGLVYSVCLSCLLGLYLSDTFAQYVLIDAVSHTMLGTSALAHLNPTTGGSARGMSDPCSYQVPRHSADDEAHRESFFP